MQKLLDDERTGYAEGRRSYRRPFVLRRVLPRPIEHALRNLNSAASAALEVLMYPLISARLTAERGWRPLTRQRLSFDELNNIGMGHARHMDTIVPSCQGTIVSLRSI